MLFFRQKTYRHPVVVLGGSGSTGKVQGTLSNGSRTITPCSVSQHRIKYRGENSITYLYHIKSFIFYMSNKYYYELACMFFFNKFNFVVLFIYLFLIN